MPIIMVSSIELRIMSPGCLCQGSEDMHFGMDASLAESRMDSIPDIRYLVLSLE
jgi:hypothetical protein